MNSSTCGHLGDPGQAGEPPGRGEQPAVLRLLVVAVRGERAARRGRTLADPGEPRPERRERAGLVRRRDRLPGGEGAVALRLVAGQRAAGPGEQRAPQVRPGLAEALHVDVHLDVRPQDGHRRHPTHHGQARAARRGPAPPGPGTEPGERDRRLGGAVQRRQPRHGGDPRGPQRGGGVAAHDQADVLLALQLRLAGGPPRAAAALHDPGRAGERGGPGRRPPWRRRPGRRTGRRTRRACCARRASCRRRRSCQTTTSASSPITPPCRPNGSPGAGAQPAASSIRCRWASRSRSRACVRGLRAGSGAARRGSVAGRGAVRAPPPGSVIRCRTTITGT